jgi:hypothetical protein
MICYDIQDIQGDAIVVVAVLSCRMRPESIDRTLGER